MRDKLSIFHFPKPLSVTFSPRIDASFSSRFQRGIFLHQCPLSLRYDGRTDYYDVDDVIAVSFLGIVIITGIVIGIAVFLESFKSPTSKDDRLVTRSPGRNIHFQRLGFQPFRRVRFQRQVIVDTLDDSATAENGLSDGDSDVGTNVGAVARESIAFGDVNCDRHFRFADDHNHLLIIHNPGGDGYTIDFTPQNLAFSLAFVATLEKDVFVAETFRTNTAERKIGGWVDEGAFAFSLAFAAGDFAVFEGQTGASTPRTFLDHVEGHLFRAAGDGLVEGDFDHGRLCWGVAVFGTAVFFSQVRIHVNASLVKFRGELTEHAVVEILMGRESDGEGEEEWKIGRKKIMMRDKKTGERQEEW